MDSFGVMIHDPVRFFDARPRDALMPGLAARLAVGLAAQAPEPIFGRLIGRGFGRPVAGGRLAAVAAGLAQASFELLDPLIFGETLRLGFHEFRFEPGILGLEPLFLGETLRLGFREFRIEPGILGLEPGNLLLESSDLDLEFGVLLPREPTACRSGIRRMRRGSVVRGRSGEFDGGVALTAAFAGLFVRANHASNIGIEFRIAS